MRENDSILVRRPGQKLCVSDHRKPNILHPDDVEVWVRAEQSAQKVVMKFSSGQPTEHDYDCRSDSNRARIPSGCHRDSFDVLVS